MYVYVCVCVCACVYVYSYAYADVYVYVYTCADIVVYTWGLCVGPPVYNCHMQVAMPVHLLVASQILGTRVLRKLQASTEGLRHQKTPGKRGFVCSQRDRP